MYYAISVINNDREHAISAIYVDLCGFFLDINFCWVVCLNMCSYPHNTSIKMTFCVWAVNILTFTIMFIENILEFRVDHIIHLNNCCRCSNINCSQLLLVSR